SVPDSLHSHGSGAVCPPVIPELPVRVTAPALDASTLEQRARVHRAGGDRDGVRDASHLNGRGAEVDSGLCVSVRHAAVTAVAVAIPRTRPGGTIPSSVSPGTLPCPASPAELSPQQLTDPPLMTAQMWASP